MFGCTRCKLQVALVSKLPLVAHGRKITLLKKSLDRPAGLDIHL